MNSFEIVCEIEPPTKPDLKKVRHQIGVLTPVADAFLIPDNHLGRATVSSIAVAHEVAAMGGRSIACVVSGSASEESRRTAKCRRSARQYLTSGRNLLGFRRDMLTAAAYGVDQFLFVYGDKPSAGDRTSELTVRAMIEEARALDLQPLRIGVAAGPRRLPSWKRAGDFVFAQVSFSVEEQVRWRESVSLDVPVYAGVMVLASVGMARMLAASIPDIDLPPALVARVEHDRSAGVEAACEQIARLRDSGAFDGVHLVPVSRYREMALRLES